MSYESRTGNGNTSTPVALSSGQPVDDLAAQQMQTIARKGRGFVLDLAASTGAMQALDQLEPLKDELFDVMHSEDPDGEKLREVCGRLLDPLAAATAVKRGVQVEVKESLPAHDEYEPPAAYRSHKIHDTESFIAYARRYGTAGKSLIFCGMEECTLVIDEQVSRGQRETISMEVVTSSDWDAWSEMIEKGGTNHKELLQFLMRQEHNLDDGTVLRSMQSMRMNATVNIESDLRDEGNNIGITVKTSAGEELQRFPKEFGIIIPILEQDDAEPRKITIRLNTQLPTEAGRGPVFSLVCSRWNQELERRIRDEISTIRTELEGWAVVHGVYQVEDRKLGK